MKTTSASASDATLRPAAAAPAPAGSSDRKSSDLHGGDVVPGSPWNVTKSSGQIPPRPIAKSDSISEPQRPGGESTWAKVINRRYHLTIASLAYVATTCVLVIGAVNGQNNLLFWIFGIAVSGLTISGLISGSSLMGIRVRREIIDVPRAGDTFHIRYTLYNANYVVGAFALVIEELPQSRGWFGKKFGSSWAARVTQPKAGIAYLGPRQTLIIETRCEAVTRGLAVFGPVRVSSTFPFGIARKSVTFVQNSDALILPERIDLAHDASSLASYRTQDVATMIRSRNGDETFALREHQPGDPMRSVAWRASARMARPIVRDLSKRKGGRIWIVLDDTNHEADHDAFERAIMIVSSIFNASAMRSVKPGFITMSRGLIAEPDKVHVREVDETLARIEPDGNSRVHTSLHVQPDDAVVLVTTRPQRAGLALPSTRSITLLDPQSPSVYAAGSLPNVKHLIEKEHQSFFDRWITKFSSIAVQPTNPPATPNQSSGGVA